MYAISVWLCVMTAWQGDIPHQRIEVFRSEPVCMDFCGKAMKYHEDQGHRDIQCTCEHRTVYDRLADGAGRSQ